jgi:predicted RNase H-like HicB family nuclease
MDDAMTPRQTALQVLGTLPDDSSWDEVLRTLRSARRFAEGYGDGGEMIARETGPAWSVEQPAEQVTGEAAMRSYDVVVERDEEGWFVGSVPGLAGCHTQARTIEQLLERIGEVIELCLEASGSTGTRFVGIRRVTVPA